MEDFDYSEMMVGLLLLGVIGNVARTFLQESPRELNIEAFVKAHKAVDFIREASLDVFEARIKAEQK